MDGFLDIEMMADDDMDCFPSTSCSGSNIDNNCHNNVSDNSSDNNVSHSSRMSSFRRKFKADENRNRNSLRSRRLLPVEVGNPFLEKLATDLLTKPILSGRDEREKTSLGHRQRRRRALLSFDVGNTETEMKSPNTSGCSPVISESSPITFKIPTLPTPLKKQVSCDTSLPVPHPSKFRKVHSTSEVTIVKALDKEEGEDLVGDFSRSHCLPFIAEGAKHQDLKSIKHSTLVGILNGDYDDVINSCTIIDCRYPYEYEAGHIVGARNIYSKVEMVEFMTSECHEYLTAADEDDSPKRNIVIFHCEFSSERGPKLMRFLRNQDRDLHQENYPALKFPEIYLLENGYKEFYAEQPAHCQPMAYLPMCHPDHKGDLAFYRADSKMYESKSNVTTTRKGQKSQVMMMQLGDLFD